MKKLVSVSTLIGMFILIGSCSKEKPRTGSYFGTFTYDVPAGLIRTAEIEISESSVDKIVINDSELQKDGKVIRGKLGYIPNMSNVYIVGEWSHKLFSKEYFINGTFTEIYYQGGNQYQNSGTFEITSN